MLLERERELRRKQEEDRAKQMERLKQKYVLKEQMKEKEAKCQEAREEFLKEKEQVDDIVKNIMREEERYS